MAPGFKYDHCRRKRGGVCWQVVCEGQGFGGWDTTMEPSQSLLVLVMLNVQAIYFRKNNFYLLFT